MKKKEKEVRVELYEDSKVHVYTEAVAQRLAASGRCKILRFVEPHVSGADLNKEEKKERMLDALRKAREAKKAKKDE